MSIRFKLILVFSIVIGFAGCLAVFAVSAISSSSELVVRMYDEPLMGINEAGAAHTKLVGAIVQMQRAMAFREAPGRAADELEKTVLGAIEDLQIVRERVHGADVRTAADAAELAARKWLDAGLAILRARPEGRTELPTTFAVSKLGDAIVVAVDDLVELAAALGSIPAARRGGDHTARAQMIGLRRRRAPSLIVALGRLFAGAADQAAGDRGQYASATSRVESARDDLAGCFARHHAGGSGAR